MANQKDKSLQKLEQRLLHRHMTWAASSKDGVTWAASSKDG
jgi:hypothetical protein